MFSGRLVPCLLMSKHAGRGSQTLRATMVTILCRGQLMTDALNVEISWPLLYRRSARRLRRRSGR